MKKLLLVLFVCSFFFGFSQTPLSNLNTKSSITGNEKIPVSGSGNPAITPDLLGTHYTSDINAVRTALNATNFDNYRSLIFPGNGTHTATLFQQIIELNDGRLLAFLSQFGSTLSDFGQFVLSGSYSNDGGRTWGTVFPIAPIEGSEIGNAIPSVWKQSDGTLVMLFWRELQQATNPITTSICKKTSTDNGATWSATSTVYTVGTYSAPAANRIFQANDGTLYYVFNEWTGGPGGATDYQYGSTVGHYKGRLLKSTNDGSTWSFVNLQILDGVSDGVLEPGLFQYPNSGDGATIGRATFYYRSRNGFVGMAYSDDNLVTWTTGANSSIPAANHDTHIFYDKQYDIVVGSIPDVAPWAERKVNVWVSYDQGGHYYKKLNLVTIIPTASGWYCAPTAPFNYKGKILFPNHQTPTVTGDKWDSYLNYISLSSLVGINQQALLNGQAQTLNGTTNITTNGGLIFGDLLIGKPSRFNPADLLSVNKVGGDTRIVFSNDDNNGFAQTILNFRRTRAGSAPSNADPVGQIMWNDKLAFTARQNNNGNNSADISFQTDTGSGLTTRTQFTNAGQWLFGDNFTVIRANGVAQFRSTSRNTELDFANDDSNTNTNEIYFQKRRGSSFTLTAGDEIGRLSFNTLSFIKAVANSTTVSAFTNNDITFWGADAAQTVAERVRITGPGQTGIGVTGPTAILHLKAGTATANTAPLKFNSGTNLTTPEAGAVEYDGTNLFFSPSTTRLAIAMNAASASGTTTGTFTTTLTNVSCFTITPTGDCTFNASGGIAGQQCTFVITTTGTTSRTITFNTNFKTTGTLATGTVSGKVFTVNFVYDGTNWNEVARTTAM